MNRKQLQTFFIFTVSLYLVGIFASCMQIHNKKIEASFEATSADSLLNVTWNKNLETMALIYNLSDAGDLLFEMNPEPRAMLARTLTEKFSEFKNHRAVVLLNSLLDDGFVDLYDIDLGFYLTDLPEFRQYANFPDIYYEWDSLTRNEVQKRFDEFHAAVRDFYADADLENYFATEGKLLFDKLLKEVNMIRPSGRYTREMENYYGIYHNSYTIVVSVFSFNGIGRSKTVVTTEGKNIYQLVSSDPSHESDYIDLEDLNSFTIGYVDRDYFREIALHEMGHAFFVEGLRNNDTVIQLVHEIDYLFNDSLKTKMMKQGYQDWHMCFEEHLVRLGEIKIARILGDDLYADAYYNQCLYQRGFQYLPLMDSLFIDYENNRNKYFTINEFLPKLIENLKSLHLN